MATLIDILGGGKMQPQGDLAGNWLRTAQVPWELLKQGVAGSGSPAESLFNALGVEMPKAEAVPFDQQMVDIMTSTMAPTAASLKMPEGFYSALEKAVVSGQLGKQQFGSTPKAASFFNAAQKAQIHPDELSAIEKLKGGQQRVSQQELLSMVDEGVPQLEKRVLGEAHEQNKLIQKQLDDLYAEDSRLAEEISSLVRPFPTKAHVVTWAEQAPESITQLLDNQQLPRTLRNSLNYIVNRPGGNYNVDEIMSDRSFRALNNFIDMSEDISKPAFNSEEAMARAQEFHRRRQEIQPEISSLHEQIDTAKSPEPHHDMPSRVLGGDRQNYRENLWYYEPKSGKTWKDYEAQGYTIGDWEGKKHIFDADGSVIAKLEGKNIQDVVEDLERHYKPSYQETRVHYPAEQGKNLLMWSRTHDRQLASGEKVSYLDEAQSGWHTYGSQEDYKGPRKADLKVEFVPGAEAHGLGNWVAHSRGEQLKHFKTEEEARKYVAKRRGSGIYGVPDAPLKKDWYKPLMRDLVRDAVTKGNDGVAWSTSEIQSGRWKKEYEKFYQTLYDNAMKKFMKSEYGVEPVRKRTVVGRKPTDIVSRTNDAGLDVTIEYRDGIKGFVVRTPDGILPETWSTTSREPFRIIEEMARKIPIDPNKYKDVWYIPITPAVRKRVMEEGQRLSKNEQENRTTGHA